jgi:hypothetical protein
MRSLYFAALLPLLCACATATAGPVPEARAVHAAHNPILSDGADYTTDPAPLVADGKLYILTGRDMAEDGVNDFIMPEWQMLVTDDPASGEWTHYPHFIKPDDVFKWATPGRAYAAQIVQGPDKKYYLYAPVMQAGTTDKDGFAIGVAVSDTPIGPWTDAHASGPVVSQSYPVANTIQNIDPTVIVDDDGRVYMYWGTFGRLKGVELEKDMVTFKGKIVDVTTLTGFFEAPWIFKRNDTYYMAYAGNKAGPTSECTQAVYYACIAYGTAKSPLGPWTYHGVMLDPVSSTTSHPGIVPYKDKWYIAYHTADANGGGHFRRSVAIDEVQFDDSVSPAAIRKVVTTPARPAVLAPQRNTAPAATAASSNEPVPVQYWLGALKDGKVRTSPLPPDYWGSWTGNHPAQQWIEYRWDEPVTLNGSRMWFFADQPVGSGVGVAPPKSWHLEYWTGSTWAAVKAEGSYGNAPETFNEVTFAPVTTRCLRAVLDASTDGKTFAAFGVQEWEALAPDAQPVAVRPIRAAAAAVCK